MTAVGRTVALLISNPKDVNCEEPRMPKKRGQNSSGGLDQPRQWRRPRRTRMEQSDPVEFWRCRWLPVKSKCTRPPDALPAYRYRSGDLGPQLFWISLVLRPPSPPARCWGLYALSLLLLALSRFLLVAGFTPLPSCRISRCN
jgi:hypothetical protein